MSMYEIEGTVEWSIECIDEGKVPLEKGRNLIYSLYKFQRMFDTAYTAFRVEDILYKYHYLISLPIEMHPNYAALSAEIEEAKSEEEEWLWLDDESYAKDLSEEDNEILFYCEAGSSIWQKLVERKTITGEEASAIQEIPVLDMIDQIVKIAKEQKDAEMAAQWYDTMFYLLLPDLGYAELTKEDLPKIKEIRDNIFFDQTVFPKIGEQYSMANGALEYLTKHESEFVQLWLEPYLEWLKVNK